MIRSIPLMTLALLMIVPDVAMTAEPQLSHVVYFKLKESNQANKEKLVVACRKFLSDHEGTVYFSAGVLAEDLGRDVNDKDFDVSLIVVFRNKAAHDEYQTAPRHLKFVEEYKDTWSGVRVFDSYIPVSDDTDLPKRIAPPYPAASFAGMIHGSVVAKRDKGIVVKVDDVLKQWKQSKAKDAEALVGKPVHVVAGENAYARRLLRVLKVGETVTLDVAHKSGEALTILELTEQQRERVK